jgi:hypothetical protein
MRPRILADRAIEITGGRTLRLWEGGDLVTEWLFQSPTRALEVARAWLSHGLPSAK